MDRYLHGHRAQTAKPDSPKDHEEFNAIQAYRQQVKIPKTDYMIQAVQSRPNQVQV